MPTQDDLTFCHTCSDSGELEPFVQKQHEPTRYIACPNCPRCEICDMRAYEGANGGKVGDDWACSPEHAAMIVTSGVPVENCDSSDLLEAVNSLEQIGRLRFEGKDFSPRDYMLLARACALMAGSIVQDAHRFTSPPSIAEGTLSEFLPTLLGGAKS